MASRVRLLAGTRRIGRSFGVVHNGLNPMEFILPALPQLFLFACGGLVLGLLALRTGNLIAPMTAHVSMNALTGILVLVLV